MKISDSKTQFHVNALNNLTHCVELCQEMHSLLTIRPTNYRPRVDLLAMCGDHLHALMGYKSSTRDV